MKRIIPFVVFFVLLSGLTVWRYLDRRQSTGTALPIHSESFVAPCIFDSQTRAGDLVVASSTVAGDCHDVGTSAKGMVIGTVESTAPEGWDGWVLVKMVVNQ